MFLFGLNNSFNIICDLEPKIKNRDNGFYFLIKKGGGGEGF